MPQPQAASHADHSETLHRQRATPEAQASTACGRGAAAQAASPSAEGQRTARERVPSPPQGAEQALHAPALQLQRPSSEALQSRLSGGLANPSQSSSRPEVQATCRARVPGPQALLHSDHGEAFHPHVATLRHGWLVAGTSPAQSAELPDEHDTARSCTPSPQPAEHTDHGSTNQ